MMTITPEFGIYPYMFHWPYGSKPVSDQCDAIREKLKAKAKKDWPDDFTTQEYWVNEEMEAYKYMKTIPDGSIKRKAQHDWPLDFSTQKFWYNEQIEAKERMK